MAAQETAFRIDSKRRRREAFDTPSSTSDEEWAEKTANRLIEIAGWGGDQGADWSATKIIRYLDRKWLFHLWSDYVAYAMYEYLYTDRAADLQSHKAAIEQKVKRFKESLNDLLNSMAEINAKCLPVVSPISLSAELPSSFPGGTRFMGRLEMPWACMPPWAHTLLERKDAHAREQLLVFRYWQSDRSMRLFPTSSVRDLMYLEGVEHHYNERTVERLYQKFTGKKNALRTLFASWQDSQG